jgi:uncharacterized RDD family membrane protein YckC
LNNDEQLQVTGLTGIDLNLSIAGPGTRSYGFIIDWHIRVLLSLAWLAGAWLLLRFYGHDTRLFKGSSGLLIGWPASMIYLLYHPVVELLMGGRTPGKRMAGARLVTLRGGQPGSAAILIRNVFRLIDMLPTFYLVGLLSCLITRQRVRIGDIAAGTILVLDQARPATLLARPPPGADSQLDPRLVELAGELLERWASLSSERRAQLARQLLTRAHPDGAGALDALSDTELQQHLRALLPAAA